MSYNLNLHPHLRESELGYAYSGPYRSVIGKPMFEVSNQVTDDLFVNDRMVRIDAVDLGFKVSDLSG